jgi:hypothetical protein
MRSFRPLGSWKVANEVRARGRILEVTQRMFNVHLLIVRCSFSLSEVDSFIMSRPTTQAKKLRRLQVTQTTPNKHQHIKKLEGLTGPARLLAAFLAALAVACVRPRALSQWRQRCLKPALVHALYWGHSWWRPRLARVLLRWRQWHVKPTPRLAFCPGLQRLRFRGGCFLAMPMSLMLAVPSVGAGAAFERGVQRRSPWLNRFNSRAFDDLRTPPLSFLATWAGPRPTPPDSSRGSSHEQDDFKTSRPGAYPYPLQNLYPHARYGYFSLPLTITNRY